MRNSSTRSSDISELSDAPKDLDTPPSPELSNFPTASPESSASPVSLASLLAKFSPLGSDKPNAVTEQQFAVLETLHKTDLLYLKELDLRIVELQSMRAGLLLRAKAYRDWAQTGTEYRSFADWRGAHSGTGARAAAAELGIAETLHNTPEAQDAITRGRMTMEHVGVLNHASQRATRTGGSELTKTEKSALVQMGTVRTADQFAKDANRWLDSRDPVRHDQSHAEIRSRRFLHVSHAPNGTHIKGFMDPIAGHTLRVALEAATAKPTLDDDRDFGQRSADALEALASLSLDVGELKTGALVKPHVSFMMSEETFENATKELKRRSSQTLRPDASPSEAGTRPIQMIPATLEDGTTIPLTELTRLLCDAEMTRIIVSADNVPTNLGRTQRLYSREQRRAIIARDRSCRFPGCTLEARWSEVHHIDWWDRDSGETSLENGILCCRYHHGQIHRGALAVIRDDAGLPRLVPTKSFNTDSQNRSQNRSQDPSQRHSPVHTLESGPPSLQGITRSKDFTGSPMSPVPPRSATPTTAPVLDSLFDVP